MLNRYVILALLILSLFSIVIFPNEIKVKYKIPEGYRNFDIYFNNIINISLPSIYLFTKYQLNGELTIEMYDSENDFYNNVSGVPDWGAGFAYPEQRLIIIKSGKFLRKEINYSTLLKHELAHICLGYAINYNFVPLWFHEGFAMYISENWDEEKKFKLSLYNLFYDKISLKNIKEKFPKNQYKANISYYYSEYVFGKIIDEMGIEGFNKLIFYLRQGDNFEDSFLKVMNYPFSMFEENLLKNFDNEFNIYNIILNYRFIWFLISIITLILLMFKKNKINKEITLLPDEQEFIDKENEEIENRDEEKYKE